MGLFDKQTSALDAAKAQLDESVVTLKAEIATLEATLVAVNRTKTYTDQINKLKGDIADLEIRKGKLDEDNAREKREVLHMVGLERKRQEQDVVNSKVELEQAKKEAVLAVKSENLAAERAAFEKQMKFQGDRFEAEVKYLKSLMTEILDRLPTVTVDRQISDKTTTSK